jgi:hypothetical protein
MDQRSCLTHQHTLTRRALLAGSSAVALTFAGGGWTIASQAPGASGEIDVTQRLGALLAASPARELTAEPMIPYYYADLAGQLAAVGIERPDASRAPGELPEGFFEAAMALPLAARAFETGLDPAWFETFGFNPYAVGQTLYLSSPPNVVTLFAGGFDRATVERALVASGYQTVLQETGGTYYSFGDDISPDTPVGRLGLGAMNQAMVHDDLLVFAQNEGDLQAVTHVVAGYEPSMLEQELWAGMPPLFSSDTVGLIPLAPSVLELGPLPSTPAATPVTGETAGRIQYLAFGVRAGARSPSLSLVGEGTPQATPLGEQAGEQARVEARVRYERAELAAQEAEAIPERWESTPSMFTGQPYSELMELDDARVSEQDATVVEIDFVSEVPNRWIQLIHTRDLAPFAPPAG